jgi:hypothetical protein
VFAVGAVGELGPILAMPIFLGSMGSLTGLILEAVFVGVIVLMAVIPWPQHVRRHCDHDCGGCVLCSGALFSCATCGGAEASLPTDCPGARVQLVLLDEVQAGRLDYTRREGWTRSPSSISRRRRR